MFIFLSPKIYLAATLGIEVHENVKNPIIQRNVNFVGEQSSTAYFIDIVTLIKN